MEQIDKELDAKQIEKSEITQTIVEEPEQPKKVKKPRSEAQIKAFEKARAKRMENLKLKEKAEAVIAPDPHPAEAVEDKSVSFEDKPEPIIAPLKKKRGRPKGVKNKKVMKHQEPPPRPDRPYYPHPVEHPIPQPQPPQYQFQGQHYAPPPPQYYQPPPQQAPVNNYYYYGAPPQQVANEEPEYAVVDSEDDIVEPEEVEVEQEQEQVEQEFPPQPSLRYRFV
jgi:hypothetical protein